MNETNAFRWFVRQAFGSDELTPYTAEYAWSSNQMAHAMMGFCLAICWLLFVISLRPTAAGDTQTAREQLNSNEQPKTGAVAAVLRWLQNRPLGAYVVLLFALIPLKEIVDLLLDQASFSGSPVKANTSRLVFDSVTDISFWWTGMFLAALLVGLFVDRWRGYRVVVPAVGLVACFVFWFFFAAPLWLEQKRVFDRSRLPFNYVRLTVLANEPPERYGIRFSDDSEITFQELGEFQDTVTSAPDKPPQKHYVIVGGTPDARTRLAVSIACEPAFKLRWAQDADYPKPVRVRYATATAVSEKPQLLELPLKPLACVVIDDLDVFAKTPTEIGLPTYLKVIEPRVATSKQKPRISKRILKEQFKLESTASLPLDQEPDQPLVIGKESFDDMVKQSGRRAESNREQNELTETDKKRLSQFIDFGASAKDASVSTVWVLSGYSGEEGSHAEQLWKARRKLWLEEIAKLLIVGNDELNVITLETVPEADE